jgi:multiple sugar transport system substrate-binding protein
LNRGRAAARPVVSTAEVRSEPMVGRRRILQAVALGIVLSLAAFASGTASARQSATTLTLGANAVVGGKNAAEASWLTTYVIPNFEKAMAAEGKDVDVRFQGTGVADEAYKAQIALDLRTGGGADIVTLDGIWVGEFAQAGFIKPLRDVVGPAADNWTGWQQIPKAVQTNMSFKGRRYGIPAGTDGRVLYYNKDLFRRAGLPQRWQPRSWADILSAARRLKARVSDVTPLQINAGTAMGEATTAQGFLPLLVGTGKRIYNQDTGKWLGNTRELRQVLSFYQQVYRAGLGDRNLQLRADGRDRSFQQFSQGRIAILAEGDFFWRSVVNPNRGTFPMQDRNTVVGWALIPARAPFAGIKGPAFKRGQSFVSLSGGGGRVINPNTGNAQLAWELLTFMNSKEPVKIFAVQQPRITQRSDVNKETLYSDPLLGFVARSVLPLTYFRPGQAVYPQVSQALQLASQAVVAGRSVQKAASDYQATLVKLVGAGNVESS